MAGIVGAARLLEGRPLEIIHTTGWVAILALGLTTALSRLTMFSALERLGGVETSIAGPLELLVSLVLALLLLGDRLTGVQWAGGLLLMASLWLISRDPGMRLAEGNEPLEWRQK
jgi:drug/metabolite transporter (DMT)-like permease